jgi:hypothetical protein
MSLGDGNLSVGVSYAIKPEIDSEAKVNITKVANLPKGLSWKSGKITGVPTKTGSSTVSVTVALATNAKKTWTLKQALKVSALPSYAKGTYTGALVEAGADVAGTTVTLTVGTTGKISGKFTEYGTNWTLTATSYTSRYAAGAQTDGEAEAAGVLPFAAGSDVFECSDLAAKYSWQTKSGKKTVTKTLTRRFILRVGEDDTGDKPTGLAIGTEPLAGGKGAYFEAWQKQ